MAFRSYVLVRTKNRHSASACTILRKQRGVVLVDQIEGIADVIFIVEAANYQSLVELTIRAIASVMDIVENIQLLPGKVVNSQQGGQRHPKVRR